MLNLAGYQETNLLYAGNRTLVYQAIRSYPRQPAIVKVLRNRHPNFHELVQFRNQYMIARHLEHPRIVLPLALESYGNGYALVMPDDGSLALSEYWQKSQHSIQEFLTIALQLAEALHYLLQKRIIHKDIKPANILIHPKTHEVKLIDFSISSLLPKEQQQLTNPNILEGTLAYISPEQTGRMNRGIDYRTDFYSLGVTFFELLTGKLPFETQDPMELVHCHIAQKAKFPKNSEQLAVPEVLQEIVLKLIAKNAEDRYQSILGLKHDLEQCLQQLKLTGKISQFQLGERDICDRFLIPDKLYGREAEVQQLLNAFERVASGATEIMLVAGFSGIGKTAVINEVHKPIVKQRGYFIKGKFDQFNRNIPFAAFVQAFRDLIGQLLGESNTELATWKAKILEALGEDGQVLIDVIPELEQIIGKQPPVSQLSGSAAHNRFNLLFGKFVRVFTQKEHPLVLFLDDLQWADSTSLTLLKLLMDESEAGYLLVLGAYRDNEVSPSHPLMLSLAELQKNQVCIATIVLQALNFSHINGLVAETLSCDETIAQPLTELVYQKTQGNPFFTTQFLQGLYEDELIAFNLSLGYWECDLAQVRNAAITEDVVEFMAGRLQKLPRATQEILKLAACIGNQFDLKTLAIVNKRSHSQATGNLWLALQEGLVLPTSDIYKFFHEELDLGNENSADRKILESHNCVYRFLHDRVQQAAYSLIPENQKQETHYHIGKLLLENLSIAERDERIFDVVNQINIGKPLLKDDSEKKLLAQLNLTAGQKAKAATAYDAAKTYSLFGIDLLAKDAWVSAYSLAFELHFNFAEAALMSGDFQSLEETVLTLLKFANSKKDRAKIYVLRVAQYSLQGQFLESIQAGLQGLESLGIAIDRDALKELAQAEFTTVESSLKNRSIANLLDLPMATNPEVESAIELLIILQAPAYIVSDFDLYSFATFRAVRLSIEQGNTAESIKAYATYGFLIGLMYGQYQRGMEFAELALQLSYKLNSKFQRSGACFMLGCCIQVWAKPIQGAAAINYEGFMAGLESGEIPHAGYNLYSNICNRLFQGENLTDIALDIDKYWAIGEKLNHDFLLSILASCRFFVNQLSQSLDEQQQTMATEEQAWVERYEALKSYTALGTYYILQMHRACLIPGGKPDIHYFHEAGKFLNGCAGFTTSVGYYYYGSLILCNRYPSLPEAEGSDLLQQIETNQAQLKLWSESCPENFRHKYLLVAAERARILGKYLEAIENYEGAIAEAKANRYLQEEALAYELAARFYLDWGKEKIAQTYMEAAYYCYARWGAKAKTDQLEKQYPQLLTPILEKQWIELKAFNSIERLTQPIVSSTQIQSTSTGFSDTLDLASILQAAQTLSSTLDLEQLLAEISRIILTNAGAQKMALLIPDADQWQLRAIVELDSDGKLITTTHLQLLTLESAVPIRLIQYVKNTQQPILIDEAKTEITGIVEGYLLKYQPQSVFCVPLLNQGKLVAILYLEHPTTKSVFTSNRQTIIQFLCTQAAIALENAQLYDRAQQALQELQKAQLQIVQSEKMSALGNLVSGIAHEINNPLGFIAGNISIAQENLTNLLEHLTLYEQKTSCEDIADHAEDIDLEYMRADFPSLLESMNVGIKRIKNISTSLRIFSRQDREHKTAFNIHEGIESTLLILKHRTKANEQRPEIEIITDYEKFPEINCFPGQLNQVFMNILANAIDAFEEANQGKTYAEIEANRNSITIRTLMLNKHQVEIQIQDNGYGMKAETKDRIFEQGFTTKGVGKGTGLGMAIAHQIVTEKHGGTITCDSVVGKGTTFIILLPVE